MAEQVNPNSIQYISLLLNDVEQTKNYLGAYNNLILSLQTAYPNLSGIELAKAMSQADKVQLSQTIAFFRSYATRAYINFKSISKKFRGQEKEELVLKIEASYKIIQTTMMPPFETALDFVQNINDLFVEEINVQALLNTKQKLGELSSVGSTPAI